MRRETRNGCVIKVWSMSIMGWRYHVVLEDGTTKAGTKKSEQAALTAARKVASELSP